jgi:hypothetical protein
MKRSIYNACRVAPVLVLVFFAGCGFLREIANLRLIDFSIASVTNARLAGVNVERIQSYENLSVSDMALLGMAVARGRLPVEFVVNIQADNPEENGVQARLVQMDWTLLLEDRPTISGLLEEEYVIPPGAPTIIPLRIQLDLLEFFDRNLPDLVELVLAISGQDGGAPKRIRFEATPSVQTPLGRIRYPHPITIASREVGS